MGPAARRLLVGVLVLLPILGLAALAYQRYAVGPGWLRGGEDDADPVPDDPRLARGKALYSRYCLGCHGHSGDGNGPVGQSITPPTPDFGHARFRLVTTVNAIPSDDDLIRVIENGIPGTGMFAFPQLNRSDLQELAAYVRHLTRARLAARLRRETAAAGEPLDPDRLAGMVERLTRPGTPLEMPARFPEPTAESLARGAALYHKECAACHGPNGKGDGPQEQRNADGTPARPRDFTQGVFKGGRDPRQLYARIRLGIPGSPMPAFPHLTPEQIGDLINHVLSYSENRRDHPLHRDITR
jgi:mono/diheme cytochrome c family protein